MAERYVDAAYSDGTTAIFFLADHYVVYDWAADRARDGVHPVTSFPPGSASGVPADLAPVGPDERVDAALPGKHAFAGVRYLFRGADYARFAADPPPGAFDPASRIAVAGSWGVPSGFEAFTAAWNGAKNRDAYAYFFSGNRYVRYRWADDGTDAGYPKPVSNMIGIPADFAAAGPDAAVDGGGAFEGTSYLFLNESYLRFRWVDTGEPHGDGTSAVQDGWPGLAELLLTGRAVSAGLVWLREARAMIDAHQRGAASADDEAVLAGALQAHFKTTPADTATLAAVDAMLARIQGSLEDSAHIRFRDDAQAAADGRPEVSAAYASPTAGINVTRNIVKRTELNRISSLLHEAVHVHDPASGTPDVHVSEWYVTPAAAPALGLPEVADMPEAFTVRYDLMTTAASLHNPSSYATFARHVHFRHDSREIAT